MRAPGCGSTSRSRTTNASVDFDPTDSIADETIAHLLARGTDERWLISCFRIDTVDRCRALAPQIRTAWLTVAVPPDAVAMLVERGHAALHPWVEPAGSTDRRRLPCGRPRGQHVDVRRPGAHRRADRRGASTGCAPTCPTWPSRCGRRQRTHQADRVGPVLELQSWGLAEVVAVELVGERRGAGDGQRAQVGAQVEVLARLDPAAAQRAAERAEDGPERASCGTSPPPGHARASPPG